MAKRKCAICGEEIPNKSREDLIDSGYNSLQIGRNYYIFCPKHTAGEIVSFIKERVFPGVIA